jgi:Phosphate transporter family
MDVILSLPILIALIVVALCFDFLNGLHDAANSIATIVSTRVLRPHYAVGWAAFFNFIAFLFFGLHVANTLGTGIIAPNVIDPGVVFGALMGAIIWNLITWGLGIPSSSSHARRRPRRRRYCQGGSRRNRLARSRADRSRDRRLAARRILSGVADGSGAFLDLRSLNAFRRRPHISASAIHFRVALFAWSRWKRRTEDHGHHRGVVVLAGSSRCAVPRPILGCDHLPDRDGTGNACWWMAYREDNGLQNYAPYSDARFLRGNRRRRDALRRNLAWHSRIDHAHDDGVDYWRGRGAKDFFSALECRKQYCRGLDYHDPGVGRDRRDSLRAHKVLWLIRLQRARGSLRPPCAVFGAIRLSRNDQVVQRLDCQGLSAVKMIAQ